jgi:DNA-binding NarL/FixJ family response regulator
MAGPSGSSKIAPTSANGLSFSVSTTSSLLIPWEMLSQRAEATLRQIGTRMAEGYSETEISVELGISRHSVIARLDEVKAELVRLSL